MRVDSHQHFWNYTESEFGWISDEMAILRRNFLPADLKPLLEAAGYDGCVAVQAPQTLEETRFLLDLADENPWILGVVGWIDLLAVNPFDVDFLGHPKLKGVRHIVQAEPPNFLFNTTFRANAQKLPAHGLTYDILIYHDQMDAAYDFAWSLPDVPMVLDHIAKPDIRDGQWKPWAKKIKKLATLDNLCIKLSGMAFEADWKTWEPAILQPYINHVIDCFEPRRCMIGSDWPVSLCAGSYARTMDAIEEYLRGLSATDTALITGGTAQRFYGIG